MLNYEVDDAAMWEASEDRRLAHKKWDAQELEDDGR